MNKNKKIFCLSTSLLAFSLAVCAISMSAGKNGFNVQPVRSIDSWTEKAYEAPTGSSVGYKHYYLGCPGNERTSDAEHNNPVSLEDITIPALNVIDSSAVAAGSNILDVRNAKMRYLDQCTVMDQDGGTPVYVMDGGHQAAFISRSNSLGDAHNSEFRFEFAAKNGLNSITFDYRYLDYGSLVEDMKASRVYLQAHNSAYVDLSVTLINDDQWHTATVYTTPESTNAVYELLFCIWDFQGHLFISNLEYHGFSELGLSEASGYDGIIPTSLSEYGIADNTAVPIHTAGHVFGNGLNPEGVDLWFTFNYAEVKEGEDAQLAIYLFNQMDESGIRFRFETNRTEDDGIVFGYIITPAGATQVIFPKTANIKTNENVTAHIFAYLTDASTNTYTVGYQAGVSDIYNPVVYPGGTGYEVDSPVFTQTAVLGAGYFDEGAHRYLRISGIRNGSITIGEATSKEEVVVYKDADGTLIGKKEGLIVSTFDYHKAGKKLVGWFDHQGNRVENNQPVTSKTVISPLFVDEQAEMIVPSDIGFMAKGQTKVLNGGEVASDGYEAQGNRVDMYFIYGVNSRTDGDKYSITGFPYDMLDGQSRLCLRINENDGNYFDGYIYGGSLGGAGAEGTYFDNGANFRRADDKLLIHMGFIDNGSNNIDFMLDVINLRTRAVFSANKNVTFSNYSIDQTARNKISGNAIGGLEYTISDAF